MLARRGVHASYVILAVSLPRRASAYCPLQGVPERCVVVSTCSARAGKGGRGAGATQSHCCPRTAFTHGRRHLSARSYIVQCCQKTVPNCAPTGVWKVRKTTSDALYERQGESSSQTADTQGSHLSKKAHPDRHTGSLSGSCERLSANHGPRRLQRLGR